MKLFVRLTEIAEMLCCSESAALTALEKHNVRPYRHGNGRGRGNVWYYPAILQLAADMHEEAQKNAAETKPRTKKPLVYDGHIVSGKSKSELKLLLSETSGGLQ